jgi:5-formyltetrahydrofolate cyclo-ligase
MAYRPWSPADPLAPDGCGIPAPLAAAGNLPPAALAVLLVPALAFDPATGIRLGSGGGWYDRLRADPAWVAVPALAVLPAHGLHPGLPREPWDLPFDGWLDGDGLHGLAAV